MLKIPDYYYYSSDGKHFTSKIEATLYSRNNQVDIKFHYYDDVYNKINWKIEPPQSLDYYYLEQARKIRDSYDRVILAYSGGYDSTNILETFHFNGLKFDKIITVGALKQDSHSGVDENHNGELYHNVFPYLKELGLESISEVYDYTNYFNNVKNFSLYQYGSDWVDVTGSWYSPHNWFWRDLEDYVIPKQWKDQKVAIIFGRDKPSLFYENTRIGFYFRDNPVNSYGNISGKNNSDRINFYWDPTYPEILLKQLHVLKNAYLISKNEGYDHEISIPTINNMTINQLVYNLRRPILFKSPKSKDKLLSLRDNYLKEKTNSEVYSFYSNGLNKISKQIGAGEVYATKSQFYDIT